MTGEKTERATPRRRKEVREKGQVARSSDVAAALIILTGFLLIGFLGGELGKRFMDLFQIDITEYTQRTLTEETIYLIFAEVIWEVAKMLLPIFAFILVIGIAANIFQVGFMFVTEPLKMKLDRLNPIEGVKRIFSLKAFIEFGKSILKFVVIAVALGWVIWSERERLLMLSQLAISESVSYVGGLVVKVGIIAGTLLLTLAVMDYFYQHYEHEKNIRMSKQDIKDEYKRTEGDPLIRSRIKERQRAMAMRRMMQEVPKADVIITNPTHYAVALKYEPAMPAPQVIAKGQDRMALRIKKLAEEYGVVIVENPPLARMLYTQVELSEWVPPEMFQAVAEVLAYVYRLK